MADYPERRTSRAARWARRAGAFSLVLLLTVVAGHWFELVETPAFFWVLAVAALLAALALLFAAFAFSRLWNFGDRGGRDLTVGALLALATLVPYALIAYKVAVLPPLRDISTDPDDPPALTAFARAPDMNALAPPTPGEARLQAEAYPLVAGRRYDLPLERVADAVKAVVDRRGWTLTAPFPQAEGETEVTVQAVDRSFILNLPADVAIRVADQGDSTTVDMRSASRYGRHDLGDNADRIVAFLADLDQEIAGQPAAAGE